MRELGLNAEIGVVPRNEQINRGVGKFYNETPLIDELIENGVRPMLNMIIYVDCGLG